jgi:hypothetical protein
MDDEGFRVAGNQKSTHPARREMSVLKNESHRSADRIESSVNGLHQDRPYKQNRICHSGRCDRPSVWDRIVFADALNKGPGTKPPRGEPLHMR